MKITDNFNFGDIVLSEFIFTDNSETKLRPVLVLFKDGEDYTVLKITSQIQNPDNFTMMLEPNLENNIRAISFIKIKKINLIHETLVLKRKVGNISQEQKNILKDKLLILFKNL